jgi:hypothetical protein
MIVRMLVSIAGHADPANGLAEDFGFAPGELHELEDGLAEKWIAAGIAEVPPAPKVKKSKHVVDAEAKAVAEEERRRLEAEGAQN